MKLLVCKMDGKLLETRVLNETENIKYEIIEDVQEIEEKQGFIGKYTLNDKGKIIVTYEEKPKTIEDKIADLEKQNADLLLMMARGVQ